MMIFGYIAVSLVSFFLVFALTFEGLSAVDINMSEKIYQVTRVVILLLGIALMAVGVWLAVAGKGENSGNGFSAFLMLPIGMISGSLGVALALLKRPR